MSKKFTGDLALRRRPRPRFSEESLPNDLRDELTSLWESEDDRKLALLAEHYAVPPLDFRRLCIRLAEELVPGFQDAKPSGRKQKWNPLVSGVLVVEMERKIVKGDRAKGITWAAGQLAKQKLWRDFIESRDGDGTSPNPSEVLRTKYTEWKSEVISHAMRRTFKANPIERWEQLAHYFVRNDMQRLVEAVRKRLKS